MPATVLLATDLWLLARLARGAHSCSFMPTLRSRSHCPRGWLELLSNRHASCSAPEEAEDEAAAPEEAAGPEEAADGASMFISYNILQDPEGSDTIL